MRFFHSIIFFLFSIPLFGAFVGNPANPLLFKEGLIFQKPHLIVRTGYIFDDLYHGRMRDRFKIQGSTPSHLALRSNLGIVTITLKKHADFYGFAGGSMLCLDKTINSSSHLSWGGGVKLSLFHFHEWTFGGDVKYFNTKPSLQQLLLGKLPAALVTPFALRYEEWQGAFLVSYAATFFSPYLGFSYLFATLTPDPDLGLLKIPGIDDFVDFRSRAGENRHKWGMVVGISLLSNQKAALNLESRLFGQNAYSVSGEVRF